MKMCLSILPDLNSAVSYLHIPCLETVETVENVHVHPSWYLGLPIKSLLHIQWWNQQLIQITQYYMIHTNYHRSFHNNHITVYSSMITLCIYVVKFSQQQWVPSSTRSNQWIIMHLYINDLICLCTISIPCKFWSENEVNNPKSESVKGKLKLSSECCGLLLITSLTCLKTCRICGGTLMCTNL